MSGWRLLVWKAPANDRELRKMGLRPTKRNPRVLYGRYHESAEPQLYRHIAMLRARKLRGKAVRDPNIRFIGRENQPLPVPAAPTVARPVADQRRVSHERAVASEHRERKVGAPGRQGSRPSSPAPEPTSVMPLFGYAEPTSRLVKRSSLPGLGRTARPSPEARR